MAKLYLSLNRDDVNRMIPYGLITSTRYGGRWNTRRRLNLWNETFSESEQKAASRLFSTARSWYVVKGVPDSVLMSVHTFDLWLKLGEFCASL